MKEIFKSPFFLIMLAVSVVLSASSLILRLTGHISPIDNAVGTVLMPFEKAGASVGKFFSNIGEYFRDYDALKEENEKLKDKIRDMTAAVERSDRLQRENDWLYNFLELKHSSTEYSLQNANVIAINQVSYLSTFTIDKGSNAGIEKGMPIITEEGLIGCVKEVGVDYSVCTSTVNPEFTVAAYTERLVKNGEDTYTVETGGSFIATGNFVDASDENMRIANLPEDTEIKVGDSVKTTGAGGIYPRGLLIGTVTEIAADEYNQTLYALIDTCADTGKMTEVMVITGFREVTEG